MTIWKQRWQAQRKNELEQLLDIQNSQRDDYGNQLSDDALADLECDIAALRYAIKNDDESTEWDDL